jgi:hypothetical protein
MLAPMIEGWVLWLAVACIAIGAVATWVLMVRLPRDEAEVAASERASETAWIAATIEHYGGVAPQAFVEEVLELHQAYLQAPTREQTVTAWAAPVVTPETPPPDSPAPQA